MGKDIKIRKKGLFSFLIYPAIGLWLLSGCASSSSTDAIVADTIVPLLEESSYAQQDETAVSREIQLAAEIPENGQGEPQEAGVTVSEPRIFIQPRQSDLTQILGIDFMMLEQGKSRLTLTTDKKVDYDLEREGDKALLLRLHNTTVPDLLLREIDTTHFETALEKVKPAYSTEDKESEILISLREMVPFHIKHTENSLAMDFGQTSVAPPDKKIVPLNLAETQIRTLAASQAPGTVVTDAGPAAQARQKRYTGKPMYLDFDNADVTHILRLINEMSEENIIWDPEIKGQTVSMILKDVPWDQALDLILDNNSLAKRYRGDNIIWVTTKDKMNRILAEEAAEAERRRQELEAERRRQEEERKKAEELAPLITEYLPVDFAKADEIKGHITLTDRGNMSIDTRTNTIIIKDIAKSIEEAKKTIEQFDTPVKQIMIEARIVDASENFSRDLGLKWNAATEAHRDSTMTGEPEYGGTFSTNAPWAGDGNIGLNFSKLTSSGLGSINLDASLALAEAEGTAKTLSAPKVIAQEGANAKIVSGETIYTNPTENVAQTSRDAALTLDVTPTSISYNGYVTMEIHVTDNKNVSSTLDTTKEISTELLVKSGETIVIGGIFKENEAENVTGVPVLKDIPGLGWLFKAKTKTTEKSELLIFLTPTVLPSPVKDL
jgi:type IV pilus assembly protein PilQ